MIFLPVDAGELSCWTHWILMLGVEDEIYQVQVSDGKFVIVESDASDIKVRQAEIAGSERQGINWKTLIFRLECLLRAPLKSLFSLSLSFKCLLIIRISLIYLKVAALLQLRRLFHSWEMRWTSIQLRDGHELGISKSISESCGGEVGSGEWVGFGGGKAATEKLNGEIVIIIWISHESGTVGALSEFEFSTWSNCKYFDCDGNYWWRIMMTRCG